MDWSPVAAHLGARIVAEKPLKGGVSAEVAALDLGWPDGSTRRVVARRNPDHPEKRDPSEVAGVEHAILAALHARGFPVPEPLARLDEPSCLVMAHVDGTMAPSDPLEAARRMGAMLARIHAVPPDSIATGLPEREAPAEGIRSWLPESLLTERVRAAVDRPLPDRTPALLHGDFWPGNLLWRDGHVVAVLDWEDAAVGDRLSDLAAARCELRCAWGDGAVRELTAEYVRHAGPDLEGLAIWDVYVASAALQWMGSWGLEPEVLAKRERGTTAFLHEALARIG
ncbi:MAG: phosphotransferase [Myxococcota bacterium]